MLFGNDPTADVLGQDAFIKSLSDNRVHYYVGGHDHMHLDSVFTTTDGSSGSVHDLVLASDSYKFYTPLDPANDALDVTAFGHPRQTRISEELYTIGYYVFTVDGPKVTVEYFAVPAGYAGPTPPVANNELTLAATPTLTGNFTSHGTFGYSLNGREFLVPQGAAYTGITDSFISSGESAPTTLKILAGTNGSTAQDPLALHALTKAIDTGWTAKVSATASDVLTLWGIGDLGATSTDTYVLQLSYAGAAPTDGTFGLAIQDAGGRWVNVVGKNVGGTAAFVNGAWTSSATLGSYGVDTTKKVAWAVVNVTGGNFAVATFAP
jgi:hypothetical protein